MGAAKSWWEVGCEIHGTRDFKTTVKVVKVGGPATKKERMSGCPICRKEANLNKMRENND